MASITQLSVFHKNTDATATERGYEFQKLKTVETWLINRISQNDEVIYYDYQDDIFQRDIDNFKSTFRQLKLYSSSFSFASKEIKKSVIHFFTLYCQGEYVLDDIQFVFEANSNVAKDYDGNDAKLLKKWHQQQETLEGDFLVECVNKIKEIIFEFIASIQDDKPELLKAKEVFKDLKDNQEFWKNFTKSIRWKFEGVEPEEAMSNCLRELRVLVSQLPYPLEDGDKQNLINSLHFHVSQSATKKNSEERLLDNDLLESMIFKVLGGENQEYGLAIEEYRKSPKIADFSLGKVYKAISWSRYYRQHENLEGHKEIWINVLTGYLNHIDTPDFCKKDILYELIFLKLQPTVSFNFKEPDGSNLDSFSKQYFELVPSQFDDDNTIEDTVTLYSILRTANRFDIIDISDATFEVWLVTIESCLQEKILVSDVNHKCSYLESYSFLQLTVRYLEADNKEEVFEESMSIIRQIMSFRDAAPFYSFSNLYERINGILNALIKVDVGENSDTIIEKLESLSDELVPIVQEREGKFSMANNFRDRGIQYLQSSRKKDLIKSLHHFHKAKNLLFQEETKEGFILALLNISQVYNAIGFNLAAKYYSLAGFYISIGEERYFNKISKSVGLIHHYDFSQGAWINCMMDIEQFMLLNREFVGDWSLEINTDLRKVLLDYAFVLHSAPILSNQITVLANQKLIELGFLKESHMDSMLDGLKSMLPTRIEIVRVVKEKNVDFPLNDLSNDRKIQFEAYHFLWVVKFENSYDLNMLGEEFCSIFQILLVELKTHFPDLLFKHDFKEVQLNLSESPEPKPSEKINEYNATTEWKVYLPRVQKPEPYYPIILLSIINLLKEFIQEETDLSDVFEKLLKEHDISSIATVVQPYDKLYRTLFSRENYNSLMREGFTEAIFEEKLVRSNDLIV